MQLFGPLNRMKDMDTLESMSDKDLLSKLDNFVEEERARLHDFLKWLGEADKRELPEELGYESTFDFCVRRLKLSEDEAYRRIHAARATVMCPELLSALKKGKLSLTAVSKIAPFAARPEVAAIIAGAEGKTARQIDELLAPFRPEPEKRDSIRAVAVIASVGSFPPALLVDFSFRGTCDLRDAIDRVRQLLSHKCPSGALDVVLMEVVRDYLVRHDPEKGLPGRLAPVKGGSSIAATARRMVWSRDGARCTYVGATGVRCIARRFLEIDHIKPRALGGSDSVDNLRLLCRPHNNSERRRILGEGMTTSALSVPSAERRGNLGWLSGRTDRRPGIPRCASP